MNEDLARRTKEFARATGRTFTEVVETAITELLSHNSRPRHRKKIVLPTFGGDGIIDGLSLEEAIKRADLEDDQTLLNGGDCDPARR